MIKYQLQCDQKHSFEGWFRNSGDYDDQAEKSLLECPVCGSSDIEKALMAPAVAKSGAISCSSAQEEKIAKVRSELREAAQKARDYIEKNFDNVGKSFPEEARKIHYGEVEERNIVGEATVEEVKELVDEGVEVAPVPMFDLEPDEVKKKLN